MPGSVPVRTEPVSNVRSSTRFDVQFEISFEPFEHLIKNSLPCIPAPRIHNDDWFVVFLFYVQVHVVRYT